MCRTANVSDESFEFVQSLFGVRGTVTVLKESNERCDFCQVAAALRMFICLQRRC